MDLRSNKKQYDDYLFIYQFTIALQDLTRYATF